MDQSRREFFKRTGCAALSMAALNAGLHKFGLIAALAEEAAVTNYRALVCIFMGGGNDSNNMVIPLDTTGWTNYSNARSAANLALSQSSLLKIKPTSIGTNFGLHPSLAGLFNLWKLGKVAVVANVGPMVQPITQAQYKSGVGRPYQLFSHSDQVAQWQNSRADKTVNIGWGGRVGDFAKSLNTGSTFPIVTSIAGQSLFAIGQLTRPLSIPTGALNQALVLSGFNTTPASLARRSAMDYLRTIDTQFDLVSAASSTTQQGVDIGADFGVDPTFTTVFPNTGIGNQLKQVAKIIKLNLTGGSINLNRQIFFTSIGGFDTHQGQINTQSSLLAQLDVAMSAFYNATVELGIPDRVTTFTLSDFSRTLSPSGSGGTVGSDHAWAAHHFVMGGSVLGGDFYGVQTASNGTVYPTIQLAGPDDTDTRGRWIPTCAVEQYAATLATWLGVQSSDLPTIFPLLGRFTTPDLGFLA
jgi:uncharacterized protein (DUF1501 family)